MRNRGEWDLDLVQGETFDETITWKAGETKDSATAVDLTFFTAYVQIRSRPESDDTLFDGSSEDGHLTLGGEEGTIRIYISDEETAALDLADFQKPAWWDLLLVSGGGEGKRLLRGRVGLGPSVTRPGTP